MRPDPVPGALSPDPAIIVSDILGSAGSGSTAGVWAISGAKTMRSRTVGALAAAGTAAILLSATIVHAPVARAQQAQPELPTAALNAGVHLITAEVAASEATREMGLMFRKQLAPNHGMLFVFDASQSQAPCMWMRNTLLPLSVAFIAANGTIVNIEDMDPGSEQIHCARASVPYALEMARGWYRDRGLAAGKTVIGGLPHAKEPGAKHPGPAAAH
jgi:uncharacterized membrane protein (UPF0127 family)